MLWKLNLVIVLPKYFFLYAWLSVFDLIVFEWNWRLTPTKRTSYFNSFTLNRTECKKNSSCSIGRQWKYCDCIPSFSMSLKFELSAWQCSLYYYECNCYTMCSSRKYPYPQHRGNFTQVPPAPPPQNFHFMNTKITLSPVQNFQKFYVYITYPLEKIVLTRKCESLSQHSKCLAVCIACNCCLFAMDHNIWRYTQRKAVALR